MTIAVLTHVKVCVRLGALQCEAPFLVACFELKREFALEVIGIGVAQQTKKVNPTSQGPTTITSYNKHVANTRLEMAS